MKVLTVLLQTMLFQETRKNGFAVNVQSTEAMTGFLAIIPALILVDQISTVVLRSLFFPSKLCTQKIWDRYSSVQFLKVNV